MPTRKTILENGRFYHILSRSIQNIPIFSEPRQCEVFLNCLEFYNQPNPPHRFSYKRDLKDNYPIKRHDQIVNIINYCLIPNHFHLTLLQKKDSGITIFMQRVLNSFSHFYNIKFQNVGPLFQSSFKSIEIDSIEQLIHLSRYIHLNPVTAGIVERPEDYPFSSYKNYIGLTKSDLVNPKPILEEFGSIMKYKNFVNSQKGYQRELAKIKHLLLEH